MTKQYSVLFVDDEINVLASLKRGLLDADYNCFFTSSGIKALELMEQEDISVIVTDMRMPEMDGLTLLKEVKERYPRTVRIILSGYTQLQQVLTTINTVDVFKFITKPWKLEEEFKGVIQSALDYYRLQEENDETKKALEKKNAAYLKILKSVDDKLVTYRKKGEFISNLGILMLEFNRKKMFSNDEFVNEALCLLEVQENMFQMAANAVYDDEIEIGEEEYAKELLKDIQMQIRASQVENLMENPGRMTLNKKMVECVVSNCIQLFKEDFHSGGLQLTLTRNDLGRCMISFVSPNIRALKMKKDEQLLPLDYKVHFANRIFDAFKQPYNIAVNAAISSETLVLAITMG